MTAAARMERAGTPIDVPLLQRLRESWDCMKRQLVEEIDASFGVFENLTFKARRFRDYLTAAGIPWPCLPSGALCLDDTTFRDQTITWPQLVPLHELRVTLSSLRLTGLEVGADGRNRCSLRPFRSVTGRNQPSNTKSILARRDGCAVSFARLRAPALRMSISRVRKLPLERRCPVRAHGRCVFQW